MRAMTRRLLLPISLLATTAVADTPKAPRPAGYAGLGAESVSREDLARFAPPALPEGRSRRIQAMLDVRGNGVAASADGSGATLMSNKGDRQYFRSVVTGIDQVWRQDGAMTYPVQLTGGEDRTLALALAPDETFAIVSRDVGGSENPGLYLLPAQGGPLKKLQHTPKVQTSLGFIAADSRAVYLLANDREPASYAIYRYDLATDKRELVFGEPGLWRLADHRGDATWLLVKAIGSAQQEVYEYDVKTRQLTPLLGQGEVNEYEVMYGARPGQVLVRTNKLGDFQRLYALEAGKLTPITPALEHDVVLPRIDDARARIYYHVNADGYLQLHVLDARTLKPIAVPALPAADQVHVTATSRNGRFAQVELEGAQRVPQTFTIDWQTRKVTAWQAPDAPEIDVKAFAKASLESYPARDGTKIPMLVYRPAACDGPCPVVVNFHGGPESQARPGLARAAQLYVEAGFTYVEPNVRGSEGYGKAWLHADDGPKRLNVITDIEDAARFIRASWGKDGKAPKIGVTGGSYGGYSVLMAMTYFAGAYDAGVEQVGISNLASFLMNTSPYRRALRISEYGDPVKDKEALTQLSPITHIARLKAPLLIFQGVNDPRVPVGESVQIYRQLEQRKIPGGLVLFPDEGHGSRKRSNIVLTIGHSIAFFEKYLMGK
jgi:dipeptidyl aminopeptidase/acylaminoacyl peptidase